MCQEREAKEDGQVLTLSTVCAEAANIVSDAILMYQTVRCQTAQILSLTCVRDAFIAKGREMASELTSLTAEKNRLILRCDKLALENQCVLKHAKEAKEARELRSEVQRLKAELTKGASFGRPVCGKKRRNESEAFLTGAQKELAVAEVRIKELDAKV